MTRLEVVHTTRYLYDGLVLASYNEARLTPQTTPTQLTLESTLTIHPAANVLRYWDYWGSQVTAFDLHVPHDRLEVVARSVVETSPWEEPETVVAWDELRREDVRDRFAELLAPTAYTPAEPRLAEVAAEVAAAPDPLAAMHVASDAVGGHLRYVAGSTGVHTTAVEAWEAGEGVCQDFAHLMLTLLRAAGVPARYVSGYLHPADAPVLGETVVGESHAWVEAWAGEWVALDPTNRARVEERHVTVGSGRDYGDVAPLRGIFSGAGGSRLEVEVAITRVA